MEWQGFELLLFRVGNSLVLISFLALLIGNVKKGFCKSTQLSLAVLILANFLMDLSEPLILSIDDVGFRRTMWYTTFVIFNTFAIISIYASHAITRVKLSKISITIGLSFLALSSIQILRYFDRMIIGTDVLGPIYKSSIVSINVCVVLVVVCFTAKHLIVKKDRDESCSY